MISQDKVFSKLFFPIKFPVITEVKLDFEEDTNVKYLSSINPFPLGSKPLPNQHLEYIIHELYIPGAGWRGFDPSGKGLIDERYLTLVSSSKSNLTSVITGNFIGKNNLENTLSWEIKPIEIK